jgi:hypothetical protein
VNNVFCVVIERSTRFCFSLEPPSARLLKRSVLSLHAYTYLVVTSKNTASKNNTCRIAAYGIHCSQGVDGVARVRNCVIKPATQKACWR